MRMFFLIFIICAGCQTPAPQQTEPVTAQQRSTMVQIADSAIRKSLALNPQIIEHAVAIKITALWSADSVQRKSIDSLRLVIVSQAATIKAIKQVAVIPSNQDFRIDSIKNILYIRR